MPKTKGVARTVAKYLDRVRVAVNAYKEGVANPKNPWEQAASSAAGSWKQAIQEAAGRGAYEQGIARAGESKWRSAADQKGAARFTPGVEFGKPFFERAIGDVLGTIEGVALTPRGPSGSPGNLDRTRQIDDALRAFKLARR